MNEQIRAYLAKKAAEKAHEEAEKRADALIREGLYTKEELAERPEPGEKNCETVTERDDQGNPHFRYFRKIPLDVTAEEWERIRAYAGEEDDAEEDVPEHNGVASLLKGLAVVVYIFAFIAGFVMGKDLTFGITLICWVAGLFSGTMLLGFSEMVRLLHEINQKTK